MRNFSLLLIIILMVACGSIKNKNQLAQRYEQKESGFHLQAEQTEMTGNTESIHDSTNAAYYIEILPVGAFTYDALNGFKGHAAKIVWTGKQQRSLWRTGKESRLKNFKKEKTFQDKSEYKEKIATKIKWTIPIWFYITFAVVLLLIWLYLILRRRMKF